MAESIGLQVGDMIIACGATEFQGPSETAPALVTHGEAAKVIQTSPGAAMRVRNLKPVTYMTAIDREIAAMGDPLFKERATRAGPLTNAISLSGELWGGVGGGGGFCAYPGLL